MPEISPTDAAIIRRSYMGITDLFVNIPTPTEVCRAEIETTPTDFPTADFPVINTSVNWDDGIESMLVRIYDDTETIVKFEGILRRNNEVDTVRIAGIQDGDTGIAKEFAESIAAEDIVIVYDVRVPKSFISRIDPMTEELLKRWDVEFDTSGAFTRQTQFPKPQPNVGKHQCQKVDPTTGVATFVLSALDSFTWNTGNTLSFEWELPAGLTITVGTVNDDTITVEADPGEYNVVCRVEDDTTAQIKRGYRYIFAVDGDEYEAFSQRYPVIAIANDTQDRLGRSLSITVQISSDVDVRQMLYTGSPVLLTYKHIFSDDAWLTWDAPTEGTLVENYIGFLRRYEQIARDPIKGIDTYTIYLESALQYYAALPMPGQTVVVNDPPTKWSEVHSDLANVAFWLLGYLIEFQSPVVNQLSDLDYGDFDLFEKYAFDSRGGDLLAALRQGAALVTGGNIGCLSDGRILLRRHGSYESNTYRDSNIAEQWTLEPGDLASPKLEYDRDRIMEVGETEGGGFVSGTTFPPTAHTARAGLYAQMQGVGQQVMDGFVGFDENDIRDRVGHHHNFTNAPTKSITVELAPGLDFIDPALMEWIVTDLITLDPAEQQILNGKRHIPLMISRQWTFDPVMGITKRLTLTVQPETKGKRAPLKPPPTPQEPEAPTVTCFTWDTEWEDVGDTPSGWFQVGAELPAGVNLGSFQDEFDACEDFNAVRASDEDWFNGAWSTNDKRSCTGVKRVWNYPCTLTTLIASFSWVIPVDQYWYAAYIRYANGTYEVLTSGTDNTMIGAGFGFVWSGTKNNVKEIHFIVRIDANAGAVSDAGIYTAQTSYND